MVKRNVRRLLVLLVHRVGRLDIGRLRGAVPRRGAGRHEAGGDLHGGEGRVTGRVRVDRLRRSPAAVGRDSGEAEPDLGARRHPHGGHDAARRLRCDRGPLLPGRRPQGRRRAGVRPAPARRVALSHRLRPEGHRGLVQGARVPVHVRLRGISAFLRERHLRRPHHLRRRAVSPALLHDDPRGGLQSTPARRARLRPHVAVPQRRLAAALPAALRLLARRLPGLHLVLHGQRRRHGRQRRVAARGARRAWRSAVLRRGAPRRRLPHRGPGASRPGGVGRAVRNRHEAHQGPHPRAGRLRGAREPRRHPTAGELLPAHGRRPLPQADPGLPRLVRPDQPRGGRAETSARALLGAGDEPPHLRPPHEQEDARRIRGHRVDHVDAGAGLPVLVRAVRARDQGDSRRRPDSSRVRGDRTPDDARGSRGLRPAPDLAAARCPPGGAGGCHGGCGGDHRGARLEGRVGQRAGDGAPGDRERQESRRPRAGAGHLDPGVRQQPWPVDRAPSAGSRETAGGLKTGAGARSSAAQGRPERVEGRRPCRRRDGSGEGGASPSPIPYPREGKDAYEPAPRGSARVWRAGGCSRASR